jgi:ferric-dicitrate binding protein FerR (iron transport regulator)
MKGLDHLLIKWRDGSLTGAELEELNTLLAEPEARRRLAEEFGFDYELGEAFRDERARRQTERQAESFKNLELEQTAESTPSLEHSGERTIAFPRRRWFRALALAACAVALAIAGVFLIPKETVALLEQTAPGLAIKRGANLVESPVAGFRLRDGDEVLVPTNGFAVIAYEGEATRIRAGGGAHLVLEATDEGKQLTLVGGSLSAIVAPQPKDQPMSITTPHAIATVLGTEFSLSVLSNASRLDVVEGTVRLERREDEKAIVVSAGFYATTGAGNELVTRSLLPEPWSSQDIGLTGRSGHAKWEGKKCRVAGGDLRRGRDAFHFVYQTLDGDGEIQARVLDFESRDQRTKAGVLIRESLKSSAPAAFLRVNATKGLEFSKRQRREQSLIELVGVESFPYWVRLVRRGSTITAYKSADGINWVQTGSENFELGPRIYVGLGVTSSEKSGANAAVFDNVSVIADGVRPE